MTKIPVATLKELGFTREFLPPFEWSFEVQGYKFISDRNTIEWGMEPLQDLCLAIVKPEDFKELIRILSS